MACLLRFRAAERRLVELQNARGAAGIAAIIRVLPRLEAAAASVSELISVAPELICELGFDRALISRVEDEVWYPEVMFAIAEPDLAARALEAGRALPQKIAARLHEQELIRDQKPILVSRVRAAGDRQWANQEMLLASRTRSYVAAPVIVDGEVVGMLHADRYGQRRDVDEVDRDLLHAFSQPLRVLLSRAVLNERLTAMQTQLRGLVTGLDPTSPARPGPGLVRVDRSGLDVGDGPVVRYGPRPPAMRPLPDNLTRRELEVLAQVAAGRTNAAIAAQLVISEETAKQHVKNILHKLEAANRTEAVARWFQAGGRLDAAALP
jgi:DNA-binding CsgD family transcriptional regulator